MNSLDWSLAPRWANVALTTSRGWNGGDSLVGTVEYALERNGKFYSSNTEPLDHRYLIGDTSWCIIERKVNEEQQIIDNAPSDDWDAYCHGDYYREGEYGMRHWECGGWSVNSDGNLCGAGRNRKDIELIAELKKS